MYIIFDTSKSSSKPNKHNSDALYIKQIKLMLQTHGDVILEAYKL